MFLCHLLSWRSIPSRIDLPRIFLCLLHTPMITWPSIIQPNPDITGHLISIGAERRKYASSNKINFLMADLDSLWNFHSNEWWHGYVPIIISYRSQQGKLQLRLEQLELVLLAAVAQCHWKCWNSTGANELKVHLTLLCRIICQLHEIMYADPWLVFWESKHLFKNIYNINTSIFVLLKFTTA